MQQKYAILRDEFNGSKVPVWNLENLLRQSLPSGTRVVILCEQTVTGYVTIQAGIQVFEVWHECLVEAQAKRLN